ncbi:MAG: DUF1636 family protein [Sulfitobacter sp.]
MDETKHQITICTSCKHKGGTCRPGYELIQKLRMAIDAAGGSITDDFEISGTACMAGCDYPCTVAYHGTNKATYLFGDIAPDENIDELLAFARQYANLEDGWCGSGNMPVTSRTDALARIPAMMLAVENRKVRLS